MTFDWNASYEWLAAEFRKETGLMAPAKDDPLCGEMDERRREWSKWFESRNEQAWREWHERHGMLATHSTEPEGMTEAIEALQCPETHSYSNPELFERGWEIGRSAALDIVRALLAKGE